MHTHVYKCVYKYIYVINSLSKMTNKHIVLCSVHIPRDIILFFFFVQKCTRQLRKSQICTRSLLIFFSWYLQIEKRLHRFDKTVFKLPIFILHN